MYFLKCVYFVVLLNLAICRCEHLSANEEERVVKHITDEILAFDVHDAESLNQCLLKIIQMITPYMKYGIKKWKVPVLEPLFLKSVRVDEDGGGSRLHAHFTDVFVHGLSNYKVKYIKTYPEKYSFELGLLFPRLKMNGLYDIDGKLLILDLKDHGTFTANLTHVDSSMKSKFGTESGYLVMKDTSNDFHFTRFKFHLDNLFHGSELGESINHSLNESLDDLLKEFKPSFVREINKIIVKTLEKGLENLPLEKWNAAIH